MAIFITGDTHGDFTRFRTVLFPAQAELTKSDSVIICGDFGGVWDGSEEDEYWLDWLEAKPFTTLFVDGNHENYDLLAGYPAREWQGGQVQYIRPTVVRLMRGQVYTIQGLRFFVMGGARSHDISGGILEPDDPLLKRKHRLLLRQGEPHRINHQSWWKEEMPCLEEYQTARENLDRCGWNVDCIVTHCCPSFLQTSLTQGRYQPDELTDFLEKVFLQCQFRHWFFGHYHQDLEVRSNATVLYEQIIPVKP